MQIPESLERLIVEFSKLPGVGRKTAQRLAFGVLRYSRPEAEGLSAAVLGVKDRVRHCGRCFAFTEADPCPLCADPARADHVICVVENPHNIFPIEKSGVYKGRYHVLMGCISPLDGIGPDRLRIRELAARLEGGGVEELILATNLTVQGEATALYLQREFQGRVGRVTRLSRGIPAGGDLDYVDDVTMTEAFSGRRAF